MYLELRDIIHVPDASKPFQFQMDLSEMEFYGQRPVSRPVFIEGRVTNHAGALVLEGSAASLLDLRWPSPGSRPPGWTACWPTGWRTRTRTASFSWRALG